MMEVQNSGTNLLRTAALLARCVVLVALLCSHSITRAQSYIFGRADFTTGLEPRGIAVGDFNGDGKLDLVVTNSTDNTISVLLGKTDGTFAPKVDYPTGTRPVSVEIADFNQDGILDLAVTNENCVLVSKISSLQCGPGTVSVFLGNGDGTFQARMNYPTGEEPLSVAVGDFNGDGKMDMVVADTKDNTLSILFGNGDGTFQTQVVLPTVGGPQFVVAADFNGDSKLDLAIATGDEVSILLGKGDGTFQTGSTYPAGSLGPASAVVGDFNNDGKLDLVLANSGSLSVFLGQGDGTFVLDGSYPGGAQVVAADFNGDGKLDLASPSSSFSVSVLLGNGDGTFKPPTAYGTGPTPTGIAVADFNGDGKLDLAVTDPGCGPIIDSSSTECGPAVASASVSILLGIGNGTFVGGTGFPAGSGPLDVITADFNGDGKLDLATPNQSTETVSILLGNGDGTFGAATYFLTGNLPLALASGDFRGNGHIDLAVVDQVCNTSLCGPGYVSILLGNGDGTFQAHVDYLVRVDPLGVAIGDFNGDGKPDLAVVNMASATVSILLGNGDGTFKSAVDFPTASGPLAITVGDFNRDGKLDIAVAASNQVSILLGNGDGTFQAHVDYPISANGYSIAAADFKGNGNVDLAVGTQGQVVSILLGNGDGTFKAHVDYPAGGPFGIVRAADFNADGKPDLAVGLSFSAETSILLGNGDGTFQAPVDYRAGQIEVSSLTVGDFNGDGAPDLAVADADASVVEILTSRAFKAVFPVAAVFVSQGVGTASSAQTITISNPSNVSIGFGGAAASGDFAATNNCGATLAPRAQCTISVQFSPSATGTRSGTLTLTDMTASSPQVIPLTGAGVNGPFLVGSPTSLTFVAAGVGSTGPSQSVTILNTGNAALNLTSIGVSGANPSDFSESNSCGNSLGSGQSCTISVKFNPTAGGGRKAAITIADNAPGSPQLINLAGTGLAPAANLSVASLTFPSQFTGTTSTAQNVTLSNTGNATLSISQISVSANFTESNNCGNSLAPSNSCQIGVSFVPSSTGTLTGSLTIASNAGGSPATVTLSGVGTAPSLGLGISSGGSSSATVAAGGTANFTLVIGGGGLAGAASISCSGAPSGTMCVVPATVTVSATTPSTIAISVTTTARALNIPLRINWPRARLWYGSILSLLLFAVYGRRGKLRLAAIGALAVLMLLVASCGGGGSGGSGGNSNGTPAGTYTLSVTAASGTTSQSVALTLVVQ